MERLKRGCIICGKKSQRTPFRSVDSGQSNADLGACFGFVEKTSEDIFEGGRKALQHYRNNGKAFHHVSVFLTFTFFHITYTCDVEIKIESCCMQLELHSGRTIRLLSGLGWGRGTVEDFSVGRTVFPN